MELAIAASEVVGNGLTTLDFLNYFGRCFIRSFDRYGYDKIIKVCLHQYHISFHFFSLIGIIINNDPAGSFYEKRELNFVLIIFRFVVVTFTTFLRESTISICK